MSVVGGGKGGRDCFIENESGSVVDLLGRTYNELAFHLWLLIFRDDAGLSDSFFSLSRFLRAARFPCVH